MRDAVGGPVLWDATSVFILDQILADYAETIRTAFPGSAITQAAMDELASAHRRLTLETKGARSQAGVDDADLDEEQSAAIEAAQALLSQDQERARRALEFAHKLSGGVVPDRDPASPQPEDEQLTDELNIPMKTVFATHGAARRLNRAIYSDDRVVRQHAHMEGIPAFGSLAVLDVLAERTLISNEQLAASHSTLVVWRGLGVHASGSELIVLGRSADWLLTADLAVTILDPFQWRGRSTPWSIMEWLSFLYEAYRQRPETLRRWVARLLIANHAANPAAVSDAAELLVATALISYEDDATTFTRALLDSIDRAREYCSAPLKDPAAGGLQRLKRAVSLPHYPRSIADRTFWRAWSMLPLRDQVRLVGLAVL